MNDKKEKSIKVVEWDSQEKWIPVTEALPAEGDLDVLVAYIDENLLDLYFEKSIKPLELLETTIAYRQEGKWVGIGINNEILNTVLAWMPKPKSYIPASVEEIILAAAISARENGEKE